MGYPTRRDTGLVSVHNQLFSPFQDVFNEFFDDFFGDRRNLDKTKSGVGYPKMDIVTEGDYWILKAAVPGVDPDALKIELIPGESVVANNSGHALVRISGEMSEEYRSPDNATYSLRELHKSSFRREVMLPHYIEGEPEAKVKDGILTLRWRHRMKPEVKPKVISVQKE
jgi:HSP20 family molecular chaperone IbpA